ncbi:SMC5-SMC6 complex localization factor protein 2 isoform X5 [Nycticebus coucang]|uniref:SMC5-SMC6 complex localization factor protein 2 isoform X5 n=1 Tax=Nycticebus coucang TaxID=9470 RepID=UPI00234E110A|nr:SMC5-SMC6 complex localization factor protein 2 isoform X5 [Nycticebus coucang]
MTRRCMPARPGFPSSPAPGSSPPRCHLRPGSAAPAAAGKRTESPGDRYRAEGLRRGRVAGARVGGEDCRRPLFQFPPSSASPDRGVRVPASPRPASPPRRGFWELEFSFSVVGLLLDGYGELALGSRQL